jgi:reverse gyrase
MSNNEEMTDIIMKDKEVEEEEDMEEVIEVLPEVAQQEQKDTPPPPPTTTTTVTDATFKSTSVALIEKLLQFSTPRLDVKIVNVLFLEGNVIYIYIVKKKLTDKVIYIYI